MHADRASNANCIPSADARHRDPTHRFGSGPDGHLRCTSCSGAGASLPTECPGAPLNEDQERYITARKLDFVGGKWSSNCKLLNPSGECRCGLGQCSNCLIL